MTPTPAVDLWRTLANAFLAPKTSETQTAFRDYLADDLRDLTDCVGFDSSKAIDAFEQAVSAYASPDDILVHYTALFVVPPIKARLNVAACLQGASNGAAMDGIEALMEKYGIGRSDSFHDLPDHLSSLLEFMALLECEQGAESDLCVLAGGYVAPAVRRIATDVAAAAPNSPYLHLLDVLCRFLELKCADVEKHDVPAARRVVYNRDTSKGIWRECGICGRPFAREKELLIIGRALEGQGLDTGHLGFCPECRNPVHPPPGHA